VKANASATPLTRRVVSRFGLPLGKARVLQIGVLAIAVGALLVGFARLRTPPHTAAARAPLAADVSSRSQVPEAIRTETALYLAPAPALAIAAHDARPTPAPKSVKAAPGAKPENAPKPLTASEPAERLKIAPTLIRRPDRSEP